MIDYHSLTEKQKKRYERIINTTEELMYQKGFYKLSLTELTNKLRISRSTIYEYFGSKEGLIECVVMNLSTRLNQTLEEISQSTDLSIREKFIDLAKRQSENQDANCFRLLNDLRIYTPHIYEAYEKSRRERESNGYSLLVEEGIRKGLFDPSFDKDFLVQLYLKMGQLSSETDIQEQVAMKKSQLMETIIRVFLDGTKRQ